MADTTPGPLDLPAMPTGDYELDHLIRSYQAGGLDAEGEALLREELAERNGGVIIVHAPNHSGQAMPGGSADHA